MLLNEISYKRYAEWTETSSKSITFDIDGVPWVAMIQGEVNERVIRGIVACGPTDIDPAGDLQTELSPSQKMRQAMVGFHTVGRWLVSLAKKYSRASIDIMIYPASLSRSSIYGQLMKQLVSEIPGTEMNHSEGDIYRLTRKTGEQEQL